MAHHNIFAALSTLSLCVALSPMAQAHDPRPARADMARQQSSAGLTAREHRAVRFLEKRLNPQYPSAHFNLTIQPRLIQEMGNAKRPISGNRPVAVEVKATMKKEAGNFLKRAAFKLGNRSHRLYQVQVEKGAAPSVLASQSMKPLARAARKLAITERAHDVVHSSGVRQGLVSGGLGAALTNVNLPMAVAAISYASLEMYKGVERRNVARSKALDQTTDWARRSMEQGVTPTVGEAFATYKELLETEKPGTHPRSIERFLSGLATKGL